ncbi:replication protein A 70 kDa DNA-binding subunit B-like isoform X1 [Henckelia pumila]|uniref:replication protein A 70 kDa DNA-binding subunit B-like isoform X1 n=1 Tax=Henckelia pumila TaxID=405737 RepID=UPI003C6E9000
MKLVFVDKENGRMQSIIYGQDLEQLDKLLDLYKTYFMGNAKIRQIAANTPILAASEYQMVLNRSTYIKLCSQQEQLPITNIYQLTRFAQCSEFADVASKQINLLCAVIHVFPPRFVQRTRRNLQDFVIVNEEHRPMLLTLWEEFLQNEGPRLSENVHKVPVILGIRLSVNTFYGLSVGTMPNSTFLFDPPIAQAAHLKLWIKDNKDYIENVVSRKLYEKSYQSIDQPADSQIRKISQILSVTETVKSFWVKATLKVSEPQHCLYVLACPDCSRTCGALYGYEFTCLYCGSNFPSPKPLLRFQVDLFDGTGNLPAYLENEEAEILLGSSAEKIIEAKNEEEDLNPCMINEKLKDLQFLFQIRTSRNETRGKTFVRNTIVKCLQHESSSTVHTSKEPSSSAQLDRNLLTDLPMIESQESSSKIEEEQAATNPVQSQTSSTGKRGLDCKEMTTQKSFKHHKED